jgi:hypothetical protein
MNRIGAAQQLRRALQLLAMTFTDEKAMEVAAVFDLWQPGKTYESGEFVQWGENALGDPQLYKVAQSHLSQADWLPENTPALYIAVGLDEQGYPIWSAPTGAHDAYNQGDVVSFEGQLYESLVDGNVYSPKENPAGWSVKK